MTIAEWGSIGELLAALATIGTLAYLARQIRQSNRSNQVAAVSRIGDSTEMWLGQIIQDPNLLRVYTRALTEPSSLDREERARFNLLIVQFLRGIETGWLQVKWGIVEGEHWAGYCESIKMIVGSDAGRRAFNANRSVLSESFAVEVEKLIGS